MQGMRTSIEQTDRRAGAMSGRGTQELLSALAANRKQFFELVEAVERQSCCLIDESALAATIDAKHAGQDSLSTEEAFCLLLAVSHPVVTVEES